jgi:hypothetical protein
MILISHRGNLNGPIRDLENSPTYIDLAFAEGYDAEIDIWFINGNIFLGHDEPTYLVNDDWIINRKERLWLHCKNIDALIYLKNIKSFNINYFWHQKDDVTITSLGYFWTYPGKQLTENSIAVLPEISFFQNLEISKGICSDFVFKYK